MVADLVRLLPALRYNDGQVGIGIDVVSISEFARTLSSRSGCAFVARSFTDHERAYSANRPERLAVRWAAKEAVAKAIGTGFRGIRPSQIEIVHSTTGAPFVRSAESDTWPLYAHTWQWSVTLSHEGDAAIAFALGIPPAATRPGFGYHVDPIHKGVTSAEHPRSTRHQP